MRTQYSYHCSSYKASCRLLASNNRIYSHRIQIFHRQTRIHSCLPLHNPHRIGEWQYRPGKHKTLIREIEKVQKLKTAQNRALTAGKRKYGTHPKGERKAMQNEPFLV